MKSQRRLASRLGIVLTLTVLALLACRAGSGGETAATSTPAGATEAASPAAGPTEMSQPEPTAAPAEPTFAPAEPTAVPAALPYQTGRNDFVTTVDGVPREWLVYVPASYAAGQPAPVVFMFHGSNQGGPLMYENTTWSDQADQHGILVVFPTGWKYPLVDEAGRHSKWNTRGLVNQVQPGTELMDDVHFVQVMLAELQATFSVDTHRVYATGFSNGAGFVLTRLIPEMSTTFAAYATAGSGLMSEERLEVELPVVPASLYSVLGTQDQKVAENTGYPLPFPVQTEAMLVDPLLGPMFVNTTDLLGLELDYTAVVDEATGSNILTFNTSPSGVGNQYIFRMVDRMGHVYPSGHNNRHELDVAPLFWDFFGQYSLP